MNTSNTGFNNVIINLNLLLLISGVQGAVNEYLINI